MRADWQKKKLIEVCEEITDGSHFSPKTSSNAKYPYITVRDINNEEINFKNCKFIDEENYKTLLKNGCKPNNGDLLFSKDGTVGKVALVDFDKEFVVLSSLAIIRPKKEIITSTLLKYILLHPVFLNTAIDKKTGVAIRRIILRNLKKIEIQFPNSLSEQQQIVALLDEAFAGIEQAKANIEKNIVNAKELFQSKLNEIFSQRGDGWEERSLGSICENLDKIRVPITKNKRISGDIPYYGASGIVDYVIDYLFDEDLLLVSEDGANLLARTYPIAFSISGKNWVNNHAHVLRFKKMTTQRYVEYYLNSIKLDVFISGMAQPKLNQAKLNSIPIPLPNLEVQKKVVYIFDMLNNETKKIKEIYQQKLQNLEELKKSLLEKAFKGELTNP